PMYKQINLVNRWKYHGEKIESMFGIKGLYDDKLGGQSTFNPDVPVWMQTSYGFGITTRRAEVFNKTSYNFDEHGDRSLGIQANYTFHDIDAFYGLSPYGGRQQTVYLNLIYQRPLMNEQAQIRLGGGILSDWISETYRMIQLSRAETVSGLFAEYTYTGSEKWSLLAGVRGDYNARLNRLYFIPRANLKYSLNKSMSLRASAGSGFRTANIFAENAQLFASNRNVNILEALLPEYSWNYGLNFSYTFQQRTKEGRFSVDLFRTDFINQVVADFDASPQSVNFYNLNGNSYAWYFQAEWYREIVRNVDIRLAYKFNDVWITQRGILMEKMLNAKHRALLNVAYQTPRKNWKVDFTTQWVGKQRLPDYSSNPETYQIRKYSPSYFRMLGQITYLFKKLECYVGSENINNFTQKDLIIDPGHPNGEYFDAGSIWGPTLGRMIYGGFRYTIL
ncbi:MAG TPA: TonB-dependent receptor, partial [Chitinophagaceae bacterium]|nr:TonB-dependent receptor [Chitinophagaceae bacterium]